MTRQKSKRFEYIMEVHLEKVLIDCRRSHGNCCRSPAQFVDVVVAKEDRVHAENGNKLNDIFSHHEEKKRKWNREGC